MSLKEVVTNRFVGNTSLKMENGSFGYYSYVQELKIENDQVPLSVGEIKVSNLSEETETNFDHLPKSERARRNKPEFKCQQYLDLIWNKINPHLQNESADHVWVWFESVRFNPELGEHPQRNYLGIMLNCRSKNCETNSLFLKDLICKMETPKERVLHIGIGDLNGPVTGLIQ